MTDRSVDRLATRHAIPFLLSVASTGCGAGWQAVPAPIPATFVPRQVVEVWSHGRPTRLHGVVVTPDSIAGVAWLAPLDCDSCRVGFLRTEVDSVRTGDPTGGFWGTAGLAMLGLVGLIYFLCSTGSGACPAGVNGT